VQPPLNLVVIWRDLLDNANIEPSSPVEMDGPANIQLDTALRNLLDAISDPLATGRAYRVDSVVTGGAITVATRIGLPQKKLGTRVYESSPRAGTCTARSRSFSRRSPPIPPSSCRVTQRMMTGTKTFDAELSRIQWTARRLEQTEARIYDLKTRIENLRPCTVGVIGGAE
jgi:hypothetical protein